MERTYLLKKHKGTEELHLFKSIGVQGVCMAVSKSLCEVMDRSEGVEDVFRCLSEIEALKKCAEIGRRVCGNCVKSLYATLDE